MVDYKIGTGPWTRVSAGLFANNPYNATVKGGTVLAGERAFSGFSVGWSSSRINLATFAGKTVRFRFRVVIGAKNTGVGWMIDDIRIYTCHR